MSYKKVLLVSIYIMAIFSSGVFGESLLVEAEGFDNHGGWSLDQQFMQTMGSPYLLAHGMGKPVADANTIVEFESTGIYRMWVRTMDWVPGNWESPGRFQVILDGVTVNKEFGTLAGWQWQDGGMVNVTNTSLEIKLHDLTGFEGRCDAIFFTNDDPAVEPVNFDAADPEVNRTWRNELRGLPDTPPDGGQFDVIIVGGGIAGCGAALAAEEKGLSVALVHDREYLGGNASIEVRVSSSVGTADTPAAVERILANLRTGSDWVAVQARRDQTVAAADGIELFAPYRAYDVKMADGKITSVDAVSTITGEALRLRSDIFIDCTGDGWIGYWAGAEYRYGRESYTEFGEEWAENGDVWSPEEPDNNVMGTSLIWNSRDAVSDVNFPDVPWAMDIIDVADHGGWKWEYSANDIHQVDDGEHIRDHLLLAIYSSFSEFKQLPGNAKRELNRVPYISGKRESRRLMGDYIYTMTDMVHGTFFGDTVVHEDRSVDVHYQMCLYGSDPPYDDFRSWALFKGVPRYYLPFRSLYSKNVDNLMMAGRCFSCSHIGLGGPRVMKTTGQMGVAVGYAASVCFQHQTTPRGVYQNHIGELKELIYGAYYEAEDAVFFDAHTSTSKAGYTGTGYLIFDQDEAYVEWTVNSPAAAMYYLDFKHYSTVAGTAEIEVNGRMVDSNYAIRSVSSFKYTSQKLVLLNAGDNTIRLTVPTYAISTVDHLRLTDVSESTYEIADAYVRGGDHANTNYGSETQLWVKNDASSDSDRNSYLRFPYFNVFDQIDTATLRLIPTILGSSASEMTIRVRLLDDSDDSSWSEDTITWNNRPSGIGNEILINGTNFTVGQPLDIDVTSLLGQSHNSNRLATFHIDVTTAASEQRYVIFGSKEGSAELWPGLLITTLPTPAAPTSLRATPGDSSVSLDWDNNIEPDVTHYDIYRSTTSGSGYGSIYSGQTASDYVDNTVTNETTYYYVVTAVDANSNESDYSNEVSATPVSGPAIFNPTEDAFVKGDSDAGTNFGSSIDLWVKDAPSSIHDRQSYLLFSDTEVIDPNKTATLRLFPTKVGSSVSALTIRVRLLDDSDDSWSEDTITWNNRPSGIGNEIIIDGEEFTVGQPLDIDVTSLLGQAQNSNKIASFHIDVTSSASASRYVVFGSKEGSPESWWPQLLITTFPLIPAAPASLTATPGGSSVSLDWDDNIEPHVTHYDIYRSTTSGSGYVSIYSGQTTSDYVDNAVTDFTTYYYVVTAVGVSSNESGYSNEAAATPYAAQIAPGGLTATASDQYNTDRIPAYAVDGSGMTGLAHTSVSPTGQMWLGARYHQGRWFKVDLGTSYDVDRMVVYNFNWSGYVTRGSKNVNVYYSNSGADPGNPIDNPGNWTAFGSAFDLTRAPGADDYGTTNAVKPDVVDFSGTTARWVSLKINSDHGGHYGGLSEILFYGEPPVEGDLTGNGFVNLQDLALFAMNWPDTDCGYCNGADLYVDGQVNFLDLLIIVENWLVP